VLLAALLLSPALADTRGMVTRVQGEDIQVNLGVDKNIKPGQKLYVYDAMGHPVAVVTVTQVDENASRVQIVSMEPGTSLSLGNQVSDAPYTPAPLPAHTPVAATPTASPSPPTSTSSGKAVDPVKNFGAELKSHTQIYSFRGGKGGAIKINAIDVLNIVSTLGLTPAGASGYIMNPWLVTSTAFDTYNTYTATAKANQRARSYIQLIYWDASLASAYADYYLYKEQVTDPVRREEMRRSLMAQKGVQSSAVFQVKIRNMGPGALQIAPFDWHCYMIDPNGNRVKAERYDEILDKALNPGQEVDGYIFFPRRDPVGKPYVANPPTLQIDDIFGERATIKFSQAGS
jgi:hypothetical protein